LTELNRKIISFDIESAEVVEEISDKRFLIAKIQAFSSGPNRHDMVCDEDSLKKTAPTIYDVPIIYNIVKYMQDFGTHTTPENSLICGFVIPKTATFERLEDGRLSLVVLARLSRRYCPDVVSILKREDGQAKVSVEIELVDFEEKYGELTIMKDWTYLAVCLLGSGIREASPLAHIDVLAFAEENKKFIESYNLEFSNKYADIDFTIPKKIKLSAQKSLDVYREKKINANSVYLAMARFLTKNEKATPEKIKSMAKFFNRKVQYDDVTMGFYGAKEGMTWSREIASKIEEIDNKQLSYFAENDVITFPYNKRSDMNPSLKGIDPQITSEQGSQIAKIAEKIGVSEEKNGWAIAISQFKKSHHIEGGKWIKNMTEKEESFVKENEELEEKKEEQMAEEKLPESENKSEEIEMAENKDEEKEDAPKKEDEETKEDEKEDKEESEEKKESRQKNMSLDGNLDVSAYLAFLENATEVAEEMTAKYKTGEEFDYAKIFSASKEKMCKMAEDLKKAQEDKDVYMAEIDNLKKFKKDTEDKQFACELESTFAEVTDVLPKEQVSKFREESVNYSLENLAELQNKIKAVAFSYTGKSKKVDDGITRFATSWVTHDQDKDYSNGWVGIAK
jgi:hypothetical protein